MPPPLPTHFGFKDIAWTKFLRVNVTTARPQVKSRSHHDNALLQPQTNVPTKYQLPIPYGFQDIAGSRYCRLRSLPLGQRINQGHTMAWHPSNPQPVSLPSINFLHLTVSKILPGQNYKGQGTARSKVKSRSHHDVAHLHPLTSVPQKYQLPKPYSF